jgi:uncharacterized membrane protein YdjX (TVP38/TMEM64 family)
MTRFSSPFERVLVAVMGVWLASVLMVPLTFLSVGDAAVFPGCLTFVYVLVWALMGSALGFVGGRWMSRGRSELERISESCLGQLSRQLTKRRTIAVAVLRLVPIAPFAFFNLAAGASQPKFLVVHRRQPAGAGPRPGRDHAPFGHPIGWGHRF